MSVANSILKSWEKIRIFWFLLSNFICKIKQFFKKSRYRIFVIEFLKKWMNKKTRIFVGYPQIFAISFFLFFITFSILSIFGGWETAAGSGIFSWKTRNLVWKTRNLVWKTRNLVWKTSIFKIWFFVERPVFLRYGFLLKDLKFGVKLWNK